MFIFKAFDSPFELFFSYLAVEAAVDGFDQLFDLSKSHIEPKVLQKVGDVLSRYPLVPVDVHRL